VVEEEQAFFREEENKAIFGEKLIACGEQATEFNHRVGVSFCI